MRGVGDAAPYEVAQAPFPKELAAVGRLRIIS